MEQPTGIKLCECGCGQPAPIAKWTDKRRGHVKGQPQRFVLGHVAAVKPPPRKKRKLLVEVGQRIGRGAVLEPDVPFVQPSGRIVRGVRLLCDCGTEYVARLESLVGQLSIEHPTMSCGCLNAEQRTATMAKAAKARVGKRSAGFVDRTGKRYGLLLVVELAGTVLSGGGLTAKWRCRCDCGNEVVVFASSLASSATKSCGCRPRKLMLPPGMSARNQILNGYKACERKRGIAWDLADEDFDRLTQLDCYYCGRAPSTVHALAAGRSVFTYNGLDRVDNTRGYALDNVVPCCGTCNRAKGTMPYDDFMAWIAQLTEYRRLHPELTSSHLLREVI